MVAVAVVVAGGTGGGGVTAAGGCRRRANLEEPLVLILFERSELSRHGAAVAASPRGGVNQAVRGHQNEMALQLPLHFRSTASSG